MKNLDWKDIGERIEWTFAQAFLAVLVASGTGFVDGNVWKSAAIGGAAAVFSLLKNVAFGMKTSEDENPPEGDPGA